MESDWLEREKQRAYHPVSDLFPLMEGAEFEALKADIKANGLREAIWLHPDGSIIDGRNRHRACLDMGVKPSFRTWDGDGLLVTFVVSMNLNRRHLTSSQRAVIALDILPMLEAEARERQAHGFTGPGKALSQRIDKALAGRATEQAAQILQTNHQYVSEAKALEGKAPDLLEQVRAGMMTIPQARREVVKREHANLPKLELPEGKFAVIYADPPWRYDNSGFEASAEAHYPTMSVDEICALPVAELAIETTILFLWATNPLLPEALQVMQAWGFTYKTNMAWIKERGLGMGWWLKSKHEFLLIGVKGETPHPLTRPDSCFEANRGPVHSQKPEIAYELIEAMYPEPYIELFARNTRKGWSSWGNEV